MNDLNSLIPSNSPLYPPIACSINSSGEIFGSAVTDTGEVHGYLAAPANGAAGSDVSSPAAQGAIGPASLPDRERQTLIRRFGGRGM